MIRSRLAMARDDNGSVMMLVIGLVPVLFLMFAVATDASVLFSQKRSLTAEADSSATAAAQAADLSAVYGGRSGTHLPLDCAKARQIAANHVSHNTSIRSNGARLADSHCTPTQVTVTLTKVVELPFVSGLGIAPTVTIKATASAESPMR